MFYCIYFPKEVAIWYSSQYSSVVECIHWLSLTHALLPPPPHCSPSSSTMPLHWLIAATLVALWLINLFWTWCVDILAMGEGGGVYARWHLQSTSCLLLAYSDQVTALHTFRELFYFYLKLMQQILVDVAQWFLLWAILFDNSLTSYASTPLLQ